MSDFHLADVLRSHVPVPLNWRLAKSELETVVADSGAAILVVGGGRDDDHARHRQEGDAGLQRRGRRWSPGPTTSASPRWRSRR